MIIPAQDYVPCLPIRDMEKAIKLIKDTFEYNLATALNLQRVSAPLFVDSNSGINDTLNGKQRPISFDMANNSTATAEIVQSLAKWKRLALYRYNFNTDEGLYTDMNAIRRDDDVDNIHSIYVDQWDWEKILTKQSRNDTTLENTVNCIVKCIIDTLNVVKSKFAAISTTLCPTVKFVTSTQLESMYPNICPKQREYLITKKYKTVFIKQIGDDLPLSHCPHDDRAADYDDWKLNGDLLFFHQQLDLALELSSMGIRVDEQSLLYQLTKTDSLNRLAYPFHSMIANNTLPLTMGGGIGQSRLCMLMLNCMHIGEVQSSLWPQEDIAELEKLNCHLL